MEKHGGKKGDFEMKIIQTCPGDPLGRQSLEGLLIRESDPENLINNKEEWNQPGDVRIEFSQYGVKNRKVKGKNDRLGGEELENGQGTKGYCKGSRRRIR